MTTDTEKDPTQDGQQHVYVTPQNLRQFKSLLPDVTPPRDRPIHRRMISYDSTPGEVYTVATRMRINGAFPGAKFDMRRFASSEMIENPDRWTRDIGIILPYTHTGLYGATLFDDWLEIDGNWLCVKDTAPIDPNGPRAFTLLVPTWMRFLNTSKCGYIVRDRHYGHLRLEEARSWVKRRHEHGLLTALDGMAATGLTSGQDLWNVLSLVELDGTSRTNYPHIYIRRKTRYNPICGIPRMDWDLIEEIPPDALPEETRKQYYIRKAGVQSLAALSNLNPAKFSDPLRGFIRRAVSRGTGDEWKWVRIRKFNAATLFNHLKKLSGGSITHLFLKIVPQGRGTDCPPAMYHLHYIKGNCTIKKIRELPAWA